MTRRRLRGLIGLVASASVVLAGIPWRGEHVATPASAATARPNIVVFYLDDTAPHDGRLWSNSALTPAIYEHFIQNGISFTNAIGETPLCCPARGTLFTGLHTHNHGVTVNDVTLFNPDVSVASEMLAQGYETMLIGKYMNHPERLTSAQWKRHHSPWSVFDVFTNPGTTAYFSGYTLFTKDAGLLTPSEHSTQMIGDRAVARMRATDPGSPIFAVLSLAATHSPNTPMPRFASNAECDQMPPWKPANYNESDVSDKPGYVRNLDPVPYPDGWPMDKYCKEMLGVDWVVARVTSELAAQGRLDNTLLVFTADNGMAWGAHRLQLKETPYVTPVPLYFSWPSRWGPRRVHHYTSNIDLAPTFCEIGGCVMGPFPTGHATSDGVSLVPLLDGETRTLGRDALLETEYRVRPWAAVRTTDESDLGLWHYVEYESGFRELYNLDPRADPFELENLAYDQRYASVRTTLASRLVELLAEGRVDATLSQIKIVHDQIPNGPQDFWYDGDLGAFSVDDDSNATLPRARTFTGMPAGAYTVALTPVPGYELVSIKCPANSSTDRPNYRATINLDAGASVTCTFITASRRPDASIAVQPANLFKGNNIYSTSPEKSQTQRWDDAPAGQALDFAVALQNDAQMVDSFTVKATETGPTSIGVTYLVDGLDVTSAVLAGTYTVNNLGPGATVLMTVRVTVAPDAPTSISRKLVVRQMSVGDIQRSDVVRAVITR